MFIQPNSNIKIYNNIPLDNKYEHTLYFANITQQNNYFHPTETPKAKYVLTAQSYQRVVKGTMRIAKKAEDLYDCNYLAFQNAAFGKKWFYAFITSVEYINNETSEITFEIDRIQTYWFDLKLKQSFVEREHSSTDNIGDNIEPEPIELGEYMFDNYMELTDNGGESNISYKSMCILIATSDTEGSTVDGTLYDGVYGGAKIKAFNANDVTNINTYLAGFINAPDTVVSMYMCPTILVTYTTIPTGGIDLSSTAISNSYTLYGNAITNNDKFGNYTPKNKKIYTYPFNYFQVDNANGQSLPIRYEFCKDLKPQFILYGTINQPVQLVLAPVNYKNVEGGTGLSDALLTEKITLESYPMCSWSIDTYRAWIAQNAVPMLIDIGKTGINGVGSILNGNIGGPILGLSNLVGNILTNQYKNSIAADTIRGYTSSSNSNVSHGVQAFFCGRCRITEQRAIIVDEYFTRFGYATNRIKVPNISARKIWNYVKTSDCKIIGHAPADDIAFIENLFNKGITFWKDPSKVGTYTGDNSIE